MSSLSDITEDGAKSVEGALSSKEVEDILKAYEDLPGTVENVEKAATELSNSIESILDDPKAIITSLTSAFTKQVANEIMAKIIAQPLCKALVPKYIAPSDDADALLEKMGVINGVNGMDFRLSNFLSDGRSINVVVVYEVELSGFGVFNKTLVIKQTASTAAWVKGKTLKEVVEEISVWDEANFSRGAKIVDSIKGSNGKNAVEKGKGIHLYDESENSFTLIQSLNVYAKSYSSFSTGENVKESDNFDLKKSPIKSAIRGNATKIKESTQKVGDKLTMEDGSTKELSSKKTRVPILLVVLPEEVRDNSEHKKIIDEIVSEIEKECVPILNSFSIFLSNIMDGSI